MKYYITQAGVKFLNEARGDQLMKGLGIQSAESMRQRLVPSRSIEGQIRQIGQKPWKGARSVKAHPKTRAAANKRVRRIRAIYKDSAQRVSKVKEPGKPHPDSFEALEQWADIKGAAGVLRVARNQKQRMKADLERGWGG